MENELGRRAVACKHWRWISGMVTQTGHRIVLVEDDGTAYSRETFIGTCPIDEDAVPDISDPATLGCLLHLVREAWDDDGIRVNLFALPGQLRSQARWVFMEGMPATFGRDAFRELTKQSFVTEAEALVAALEAAP